MAQKKPAILCIMDGWGLSEATEYNAIYRAHTPVFDRMMSSYPAARLKASEQAVGLPEGQPGNSEVGHMTIGAGRVIMQDLPRLNMACTQGTIAKMDGLIDFANQLKSQNGRAHLIGLVSQGGVHSHSDHICALAQALIDQQVKVCLHIITDGRDTLPKQAQTSLDIFLKKLPDAVEIASLTGRYFAMDRDKRWERTQLFLDLVLAGQAAFDYPNPLSALVAGYQRGESDEFIQPSAIAPYQGMHEGDGVLFANFRVDRIRQIARAFYCPENTQCQTPQHSALSLPFTGPGLSVTPIAEDLMEFVPALLSPPDLGDSLGAVVAAAGKSQLRLAETEKYPHVTFFFNGGQDTPFQNEDRKLVNSPKVATYDLQPEMSAEGVCTLAEQAIKQGDHDLIIINFANPDMVGHTGDIKAAIKAVETVDHAVGVLETAILAQDGQMIVTADHGNCEVMWDALANSPHTAHTTNLVPCILVSGQPEIQTLKLADGSLCDLAPTLLELMGIKKPKAMTGHSLIQRDMKA